MKVGIVGSGNMGAALGNRWAKKGHDVMFSYSKDPTRLHNLAKINSHTFQGSFEDAVAFGEIVMLSIPYTSLETIIANKKIFENKIIITCISGLQPDFSGATIGLATELSISIAEYISHVLQNPRVVEAFNTTFAEILQLPSKELNGAKPAIFYCGDDLEAKKIVAGLIEDCGYVPVNAGGLRTSRSLETLATSWVQFTVVAGLYPRIAIHSLQY